MLILTWTPLIKGELTTNELKDQIGFTDIQLGLQDIVKETDIVVHIINVEELENILNQMTDNIILMKTTHEDVLQQELLEVRNKLLTLIPKRNRQKRGLINAIGSMSKWLFGTMDEYDRQDIHNHLLQTNESVHQQIVVNDYFNSAINQLKQIVKSDRQEIEKGLNSINKKIDKEYELNIYLQQLMKIQLLKNKIDHIQDNIVSAKYGIIHPNILTSKEILKYEIDYNKLKYIQLGTAMFNNTYIIFGIKIPKSFVQVNIRNIIPIPNKEHNEIDAKIEKIFMYEEKIYKFEENKYFRQLKPSTHCVLRGNCKLIKNTEFEVISIDIKTVVVKNAVNVSVQHTCNENKTIVNGNCIVKFNNCSIEIKDYYFSNRIENDDTKIVTVKYENIKNFTRKLTFSDIIEENENNILNIKKLKYHSSISYGCNFLLAIIVIITLIIVITKHKHIKIKMNNRIQENSILKGGEVTYSIPKVNTYIGTDEIDEFVKNIINKN